jgi:hypothetical protein
MQHMQSIHEFNLYIDGWDSDSVVRGTPGVFTVHAGKFIVYPIPQDSIASAFKVYYCRKPVDMVLDADVPDLPELYHSVIVDMVLQDAYEMDEDWAAAAAKSAQTNQDIDRLKDSDEWLIRDVYPTITVRPEDL